MAARRTPEGSLEWRITVGAGCRREFAVELQTRGGESHAAATLDDRGYFALPVEGPGPWGLVVEWQGEPIVTYEVTADQSLDIDLADETRRGPTGPIEVRRQPIAAILILKSICAAGAWYWAETQNIGGSDKRHHCYASCTATQTCGLIGNAAVSTVKEMLDHVCSWGPQWLKDRLRRVSGCSGWSNADLAADARGVRCALDRNGCNRCCTIAYP